MPLFVNLFIIFIFILSLVKAYKLGFITELGVVISTILTSSLFFYLVRWGSHDSIFKVILIVLLLLFFNFIFKIIYWVLKKILKLFYILPFFKNIDQFFGLFLGLIDALIYVSVLNYFFVNIQWFKFIPWTNTDFLSFILYLSKYFIWWY